MVGENSRDNDLTINIVREKKLTNMRMATKEAFVSLKPPRLLSLEMALEHIEADEIVEVTPTNFRIRKMLLDESARQRIARVAKKAAQQV